MILQFHIPHSTLKKFPGRSFVGNIFFNVNIVAELPL